MLVNITLSRGVPNNVNPLAAISGAGAAWFNWSYNPANRTCSGVQNQTIPGNLAFTVQGEIVIAYRVTENSFNGQTPQNGFNSNLTPPGYTNVSNTTNDDSVSSYTYVEASEFGDLPLAYETPSHFVNLIKDGSNRYTRLTYLGTHIDADVATQPSTDATGDNTNTATGLNAVTANDEDGIVFPSNMIPGQTYQIPVTVSVHDYHRTANRVPIRLSLWVDWDKDNVFDPDSPEETVLDGYDVGELVVRPTTSAGSPSLPGKRTFTFNISLTVPATVAQGSFYSRLRLGPSTLPLDDPLEGPAAYGEIEEYQFNLGAPLGTILGRVYTDTNGNGTQDPGELGIANLDVLITDSSSIQQTVTTDSNGNWTATVPPGSATVDIVNADPQYPTGFTQTEGLDPSTVVAVSAGSVNAGNDGFYQPAPIFGLVYFDSNGDGDQDPGELGIPNINIIITNANAVNQTVVTDTNGNWTASVPPGSTSINVDNSDPDFPVGAVQTQGTDPTVITAVAGVSTNGGTDGFYIPGVINGLVYLDTNGNSSQDPGELGIPNIDIIITNSNGNLTTVSTNANGQWTANVPAGSTSINVNNSDPDFPVGAVQTQGTDPTVVTAVTGSTVNGGTDGFFLPASISGITQVDTDGNDIGDLTINNVTYRLLNFVDNSTVDNPNIAGVQPYVIVSADGSFNFTNLPPGQYVVVQDQPAGFISQRDWDSTTDIPTSPVDPANTSPTDNRIPVDLASGESDTGNNFVEFRCPTLFTSWELIYPTAGGVDGNPDGDIFGNVLEYAFCMPPNSGDNTPYCLVPSISQAGNYDLVFNRVLGGKDDMGFFLRYTDVLSAPANLWVEVDIDTMINVTVTPNPSGFSEQVRISNIKSLLPGGSERGFYQIAVKLDYNQDTTVDVIEYTYVEGWQTVDVEANECETFSTPFLPCPQFTGVVTNVSGLTLNLSGSAPGVDFTIGGSELMDAPARYRIEVMSGPLNGHRFDIASGGQASLTLASDGNVLTGPPFGSLDTSTANLAAQLTGAQIMLVKYLTIEEMIPAATMNATASATTADRVLFNDGVAGWQTYWANSNGGSPIWSLIGTGTTNRGSDAVPAQQGFFVHTKSQAESISTYGMVRQSNFAQPIGTSYPMFGSPYPMNLTPLQMGYLPAGFTGSRDPAVSDQVLHWTSDEALPNDTDGYSAFWLNKSGARSQWTNLLDTTLVNQNNNPFIRAGRAYWFSTTAAKPAHVVPLPWTLPARFDNGVAPSSP